MVDVNATTLPNLRTLDDLDEVARHELGHALGFGTIAEWSHFTPSLPAGTCIAFDVNVSRCW